MAAAVQEEQQAAAPAATTISGDGVGVVPPDISSASVAVAPALIVTTAPAGKRELDFDPTVPGHPFGDAPFVPMGVLKAGKVGEQGGTGDVPFDLASNPHLAQNEVGFFMIPLEKLPTRLEDSMPRKPYTWLAHAKRSTLHWVVRKLILQEIEFLRLHAQPGMLVVYAGAAPGSHIPQLSRMFPSVNFLLIDSQPFRMEKSERVEIWPIPNPFSDETLELVANLPQQKLFISDIRMAPTASGERTEGDAYVMEDLRRQEEWHQRLGPVASLLKFRLPWEEGTTTYLAGDVYFSAFAPQTTTETRMIVKHGAGTKIFDNRQYEEQMFYFNRVTRVQYYHHGVERDFVGTAARLDHCFDCSREVQILAAYLRANREWFGGEIGEDGTIPEEDVLKQLVILSDEISTAISPPTTGNQRNNMMDPAHKPAPRKDAQDFSDSGSDEDTPDRYSRRVLEEKKEEEPDYGDLLG